VADRYSADSVRNAILKILEMPEYSVSQGTRIEINSNREAVVENCRSILEYTPEIIRLLTPKMTVRFIGKDLRIENMSKSSAMVTGKIESLEFLALE